MKQKTKIITLALTISLFFSINYSFAVEPALSITDREIIESLARIEAGMKTIQNSVERNRQEISQNKMELRQDIAQNRQEIIGFMKWGFGIVFSGMFILIGFILWDRRSVLKPVKDDLADLETKKVDTIIKIMKKIAETDQGWNNAMHHAHLL